MIYGIGTDLVEVARIESALQRFGEAFVRRILHPSEINNFRTLSSQTALQARFLAKRFGAKEAFAKALGTGIRPPVSFSGIAVEHSVLGKPSLFLEPEIQVMMAARAISHTHLSISDEKAFALAFVVLETHL